jgi:hypothetical protein
VAPNAAWGSGHSPIPRQSLNFDHAVPLTLGTKVLIMYFDQDVVVIEKRVHPSP